MNPPTSIMPDFVRLKARLDAMPDDPDNFRQRSAMLQRLMDLFRHLAGRPTKERGLVYTRFLIVGFRRRWRWWYRIYHSRVTGARRLYVGVLHLYLSIPLPRRKPNA